MNAQIGALCAGGCGVRVMAATANDCAEQTGPWYCDPCFDIEADARRARSAATTAAAGEPERPRSVRARALAFMRGR